MKHTAAPLPALELAILERAFEALRHVTGLQARLLAPGRKVAEPGPGAPVEITLDRQHWHYAAEVRRIDRLAALGPVRQQFERYGTPGLLVAPSIGAAVAEHCRTLGIPFIDTAGNAYLRAPGLLVFVKGQRLAAGAQPPAQLAAHTGTATALRIVFALLCRPALVNAAYAEIIAAAGVAQGAVGKVLAGLNERRLMAGGQRRAQRRMLAPQALLDEWVANYPARLRPKLNPRRFRAQEADWWKTAEPRRYGAQWGGEVAADRLTGHLKPAAFTLYLDPAAPRRNFGKLVADHRLRADPQGDIEVLDAFWHLPADARHPDCVPPLLVYADLLATLDARNLETARLIHEQYLAPALGTA